MHRVRSRSNVRYPGSVGHNTWRTMPPTPGTLYRLQLSLVTRGPSCVPAEMGTTSTFTFVEQ